MQNKIYAQHPTIDLSFTLVEWLAVTGLVQCIFVLVYILFRVGSWRQTSLTITYFFLLLVSFFLQFSLRLEEYAEKIHMMQWLAWFISAPLSYLMVIQVAKGALPKLREFWVLLLVPISIGVGFILRDTFKICDGNATCPFLFQWLYWLSSISGGICMLLLWGHKGLFTELGATKGGREKYWLVLSLIVANIGVIVINSLRSTEALSGWESDALLTAMGLGFAYLVMTTMFRVYTPPVTLIETIRKTVEDLSEAELDIAHQIRKLMDLDKLYHEPSFSRADLARELRISENALSKVINAAFGKSFPRLLNEFRVEDAKRMLKNSEIAVNVIAFEVGFNSLASFNRSFREVVSMTPTEYREKNHSQTE